ncbi:MAG: hypothetical protein Q8930_05350 [Bacillota bacterium]|nr:hypothetical protein [Bacillota bacterium]
MEMSPAQSFETGAVIGEIILFLLLIVLIALIAYLVVVLIKRNKEKNNPRIKYQIENPQGRWTCPRCNSENPNTTFLCNRCGYRVV